MKTIIKIAKYLLEWVFTLIGWLLLIGAFANLDQFSSNYGEDAGTALLVACWGAVAGLVWKTFNLLGMCAFAASFFGNGYKRANHCETWLRHSHRDTQGSGLS